MSTPLSHPLHRWHQACPALGSMDFPRHQCSRPYWGKLIVCLGLDPPQQERRSLSLRTKARATIEESPNPSGAGIWKGHPEIKVHLGKWVTLGSGPCTCVQCEGSKLWQLRSPALGPTRSWPGASLGNRWSTGCWLYKANPKLELSQAVSEFRLKSYFWNFHLDLLVDFLTSLTKDCAFRTGETCGSSQQTKLLSVGACL